MRARAMDRKKIAQRDDPVSWAQPSLALGDFTAARSCFDRKWIAQGEAVAALEAAVAHLSGRKFCVAVNSGSSAVIAALTALGVERGAEVVIPAMSFVAVPNAVTFLGAVPVLADLDPSSGMITAGSVEACLTAKTAAVVAIDYSGFANDWRKLQALCRRAGVAFVVDAASSFLATHAGKPAGCHGDLATFSFNYAKPITTCEGGAVVTDNAGIANRLRQIRNHGESAKHKYRWDMLGSNFRMTDPAAAFGLSQLRRREQILRARRAVIQRYMAGEQLRQLALPAYRDPVHQPNGFAFTVLLQNRDHVQRQLAKAGIATRVMWSPCVDEQPLYQKLPWRRNKRLEHTRTFSRSCLSLPLHGELRVRDVHRVVAAVAAALDRPNRGK